MLPIMREWITKADADYHTALRELRARKHVNTDAACFHCQQCIEKYLKARLTMAGIGFPKTHDLARLLDLILREEPLWEDMRAHLDLLSDYGIAFRYPGETSTREQAKEAFVACRKIRTRMREALNLP